MKFPKPGGRRVRPNKFNAKRCQVDGKNFASKLEASVYGYLLLRERAGEIRDIREQVSVLLAGPCDHCKRGSRRWKVDFSYFDIKTGKTVYAEAKGCEGEKYREDKELWKTNGPGKLEIYKGTARRIGLAEVIESE